MCALDCHGWDLVLSLHWTWYYRHLAGTCLAGRAWDFNLGCIEEAAIWLEHFPMMWSTEKWNKILQGYTLSNYRAAVVIEWKRAQVLLRYGWPVTGKDTPKPENDVRQMARRCRSACSRQFRMDSHFQKSCPLLNLFFLDLILIEI